MERQLRYERQICMVQSLDEQVHEKRKRTFEERDRRVEQRRDNELAAREEYEMDRKRTLEEVDKKRRYKEELEVSCFSRPPHDPKLTNQIRFSILQRQRQYNQMVREENKRLELQSERNYAMKVQGDLEQERIKAVRDKVRLAYI